MKKHHYILLSVLAGILILIAFTASVQLSVQEAVGTKTQYTDIEQVARAANTTPALQQGIHRCLFLRLSARSRSHSAGVKSKAKRLFPS